MSIATKCTCGYSVTGFCLDRIKECVNIIRGSAITHLHARTGENEVIRFAQWYSGMDVEKVKKAYQRYLVEQPPATPLAPENEAVLFAEWMEEHFYKTSPKYYVPRVSSLDNFDSTPRTTQQLYTIYKQQK